MIDSWLRRSAGPIVALASALGCAMGLAAEPSLVTQLTDSMCAADFDLSSATIRSIKIDNGDIFDLTDAREDIWPYRLANRLHVRTRPRVIEQQLLFSAGDRYDQRVIDESARLLRTNAYFYDAKIAPVNCADGKVDVRVSTRDVWTLNPGVSFGRSGGRNTSGIELEELNLLGTGTAINLSRKNGVDRNSTRLTFSDPHLLGTWAALNLGYSSNSDGSGKSVSLARPFYSLDTKWAAGLSVGDDDSVVSLYDLGKRKDQFSKRRRYAKIDAGWSRGLVNGWVQRWGTGLVYDENRFSPAPDATQTNLLPPERKFVYPLLSYELLQDHFRALENYDRIGRTEDVLYGTRFNAQVGFASTSLGSGRDSLLYAASLSKGYELNARDSLLLSTSLSGRAAGGTSENRLLSADAKYYRRISPRRLFFTTLRADIGAKLDLDNQILLGGDNGLRGYPLRYQAGNKSVLLTVEQRYFTDYYPARLFRVGGAMFFDIGKVWGDNAFGTRSRGVLKDAGFGLRLGNSRSGLGNIIHVDVAFPLDRDASIKNVQFIVETKRSF
jgi:outer membrane protein assembly factor BamA